MLAAVLEAYVEDLFDLAVDIVYASGSLDARNELKGDTSGRLNNASAFKINRLFLNLGLPWVMNDPRVKWQKCSNAEVNRVLNRLVQDRNKIAHGGELAVRKRTALRYRSLVDQLAKRLDEIVADHVVTCRHPRPW